LTTPSRGCDKGTAFRTLFGILNGRGSDQPSEKPNIPGSYFEYKMKDPDDNTVDVSEEG